MPAASDPRRSLTRSAWILADEGHESGLAGQLTARGPSPGTFWTLPLGLAFDEAEEASWLLIDDALQVLEGTGSHGGGAPGRPKPGDAPRATKGPFRSPGGSERRERGGITAGRRAAPRRDAPLRGAANEESVGASLRPCSGGACARSA